jgi:nucleoside-diphosphate-sugar epimerase
MAAAENNTTILVTGGSGYLASWVIKTLIDKGIRVHTTVRAPEDEAKIDHLKRLDHSDLITFFKADLLDPGSFEEAMQGCDMVIHTASPFFVSGFKDAKKELIDPAKLGTRNVLESVNRTDSVKRVVLTSSVAAVYGDTKEALTKPDNTFTNQDWNSTSTLEHQPYSLSKTLAEKEAWKMAKQQDRWNLVTINPGFILGPSLSKRKDSFSIDTMLNYANGNYRSGIPKIYLGSADVRDVAQGHVNACFNKEANGRYLLVNKTITLMDIARIIKNRIPGKYPLPIMVAPKFLYWLIAPLFGFTRKYASLNTGYPIYFDNRPSRSDLNISYRAIEDTVADHFQQLVDDHLI